MTIRRSYIAQSTAGLRNISVLICLSLSQQSSAQPARSAETGPTAATSRADGAPRNNADPATWASGLARDYIPPPGVDFKIVSFLSDGVRLHGELFTPSRKTAQKLPTIIMAHGWGGVAALLRTDAEQLVQNGFQVLNFDYRGWGESSSRLIGDKDPSPMPAGRRFTATVEAVRGYIDPWEQAEDWFNAINFACGEPSVDATRIGLRGSSYSGGLVLYVAAHDARVRALVSQVGGIAFRPDAKRDKAGTPPFDDAARAHQAGILMAHGELGYPEPGARAIGALVGAPVGDKLSRWWPGDAAGLVTAPALFVLAENEELVDNRTNGFRAYERVRGPKKVVVIPGIRHYGVYREAREKAVAHAAEWFRKYLTPSDR